MPDHLNFETLSLHAGQEPDPVTLSRGVPIYRTTSYVFKNTDHAASLFALKEPGNIYTRLMNPTQSILEERISALEKGAAALALASGTSAIFYTIITICRQGDEIVSGKFNWQDSKFDLFHEPDDSYMGIRFGYDLGEMNPIAFILRMRLVALRNLGACISPDNSWLFLQGLETLALRMERHSQNALQVATFLQSHPKIDWVRYPGLPDDPTYPTASRYLKKGFGGMVVFGAKGGKTAGSRFIENLKLFSHLANVGDAKSLALHPASTSHSQLSEAEQRKGGLTPDLVRLSIGIEHIDDIIADLKQALEA